MFFVKNKNAPKVFFVKNIFANHPIVFQSEVTEECQTEAVGKELFAVTAGGLSSWSGAWLRHSVRHRDR